MLNASPIIVIGYRGAEPSIMEGLFGQNREGRLDFPNGVYWCVRHGESAHPNVESLARRVGSNFKFLRIDGFDELLTDLSKELEGHDRYAIGRWPDLNLRIVSVSMSKLSKELLSMISIWIWPSRFCANIVKSWAELL